MLMGNVTKDPDLRFTPSGTAVLNFSIATNRRYQQDNEWKDAVSFHNIVVWRNAESLAKRLRKGTRIYIEGRLDTRSWDDSEGKKQYKTEVNADQVILIARFEGEGQSNAQMDGGDSSSSSAPKSNSKPKASSNDDVIDPDDLPF